MAFSKYSKLPGDSILALLEPGEYVLNRNAVDAIGEENLNELNFEDAPRFNMSQRGDEGFQLGGMLSEVYGMQAGGPLNYGGATSELPTFGALYEQMNMAPKAGTERDDFENKFKYDPEREGIVFEDYSRAVSDATRTGRDKLQSQLMEKQQQATQSGFAGGGGGASAGVGRDTIMGDFMSAQSAAQSTLFKGVQAERDAWMREAGQGLAALHSNEGTTTFDAWNAQANAPTQGEYGPPGSPNMMGGTEGQSMKGSDGLNYIWNATAGSWTLAPGQGNPGDTYDEQADRDDISGP
jgi:hypothetical protein